VLERHPEDPVVEQFYVVGCSDLDRIRAYPVPVECGDHCGIPHAVIDDPDSYNKCGENPKETAWPSWGAATPWRVDRDPTRRRDFKVSCHTFTAFGLLRRKSLNNRATRG
jgi:hypothetical protein